MINYVPKLIEVENNVKVNQKSQVEFLFEYQKSVLIMLTKQGVIKDIECQKCIDMLRLQLRK